MSGPLTTIDAVAALEPRNLDTIDATSLWVRAARVIDETSRLRELIKSQPVGPPRHSQKQMLELIAHDLANALSAAKLCVIALSEPGPGLPRPPRDYLMMIGQALHQMEQLLADLRDIRALSRGHFVIDATRAVSPRELIATAIELAVPSVLERRLVPACPAEVPAVRVDEQRVQRVFANLIGNATKFTQPGGVITVGAMPGSTSDEVIFFVRDDGIGIREEDQARVFDLYWQADRTGRGSGLGLAVCRGIVEAHGGRITVTSRPGAGSTFEFTLPSASRANRAAS